MIKDGSPPPDWFSSMLQGWKELLFKIGAVIGIVLIVLALLACCIVPLVRGCIGRLVGSAVHSTLLHLLLDEKERNEDQREDWTVALSEAKELFEMS